MSAPIPTSSRRLRRATFAPAVLLLVLASPTSLRASVIQTGNVTAILGPTFFLDDATNGGMDTDYNTNGSYTNIRTFGGLLNRDQGPTRVTFTGFGFAAHTATNANTATNVNVSITYLGADGVYGGGDDVFIGTRSGTYNFTGGGEYVFAFDTPLTTNLPITERAFGIVINPNGKMKLKTGTITYQTNTGPRLSVAGAAAPVINPQRVNLAKYQTLTESSAAGNRLASFATDGDAGNDNRWESQSGTSNNTRIDFPFPVEIGSAQVFMGVNDTNPLSQFGIQALVGSNWTTINGTSVVGNTNVERNLVFSNPVTASSFRIVATDPTLRLREFALYPPNGLSGFPLGTDINLNLALQRPAVAGSFVAGSYPIKAVDGRTHAGSAWQTTNAGTNTLDIDMVSSTKVGSVHLYSGSGTSSALADFTLKAWNGTAWVDIPGGTVTGNTNHDRVVAFTTPPTTTRVRLEFTKADTTPTFIRELQIFPANTGNVGYALGTGINPSGTYADYEDFNDAFHQITSAAANRDIAVATGGQPALEPAGITLAQAQYQVLLNLADGTYRLRNRDTGECLSGAQLSKTPGAALTDEPYVAMPHQDWILEPLGGGHYRIVNAWSGLAIDTAAGATGQGTALVQSTVSSAATQRWIFNYDTWAPKKGLGHSSMAPAMNAEWNYNWGPNPPAVPLGDIVFHPMQWGSFNWTYNTGSGPIWQRTSAWRKRADGMIVMGFNEPDRTDQANIAVATAVDLWPQMMALNQPLVGPSPADDGTWLRTFTAAAKDRGFRWDYTAIHAYPGPGGGSANGLINSVQSYFNEFGLPVWLTEFSFVDWDGNQSWSEEDSYQTLAEFLWRAESLPALRKYALFVFTENEDNPQPANPWEKFTPAPRSNSYDKFGNLTAFGRLYAGWDSDATVRPDKNYMIHHRGLRKRMANAATGNANPGGRTIRTDGPLVNWTLVSTGVANRYYIVSSIDGRRISHTSGTGVSPSLAAAGTTGANVEWSLTHKEHGWYHIGHPSSNTRLSLTAFRTSDNFATYRMVAATTSDDSVQWRFIVPLPGGNIAPDLAAIPDQLTNELTALAFTASATDTTLPGGPIIYSILNPPFNSSINSSTGVFNWTPTETQGNGSTYRITIRASDGQLATDRVVNITVNEVNVAPVLAAVPAQNVNEGSLLTFTAVGTDADIPANTLTYSLIGAPSGATIDGSTGVFTWTPTEAQGPGTFNFTVRVSDGALTRDRSVAVTVNDVNSAPLLAAIAPQTVNEGVQLTFTASGTDADLPANTLSYSLIGAPAGAAINASHGAFSWTPTEAQGPGTFHFTVRVSDGSLTADSTASVTVNEVNTAPVLEAIAPQTVDEGALLTFTATVADTDLPANTLAYSLLDAPAGAAINPSTGVFTWTPGEGKGPGNFNFTMRVSDGSGAADRPVSVSVNEVSTAPVLEAIAPQTVDEGTLLTFTATASDADLPADTLAFSLVGAPGGAVLDPATGVFAWTPTEEQGPGNFSFTIRVSDGASFHDQPVTVTVHEVNMAPVLEPIPPQSVSTGTLLTFNAIATDADLPTNSLAYTLIGAPDSAAINSVTGAFNWTPTEEQGPGTFIFTARVSDGILTHDQAVSVTIPSLAPSPHETDTDGDGLSDFLEYALGTNPGMPNGSPIRVVSANSAGTVTLQLQWNWQATGLSWQIRHGRDLANLPAWPIVAPGGTSVVRDGGIDHITISPAKAFPEGGFYILEVIEN